MKVALVYDRVNKWGGAESVLLAIHKIFPNAPLYTSVYDPKKAPWAAVFDIKTSFLQNFPFATHHEAFAMLMPLAFESFSFDEYDLVFSVTSEAAKGIITKPGTLHVCYCLTPTRYLWSGYDLYFKNKILRFISLPAVSYLRFWDKIAAQRPDTYIAISKEVQSRIKKYYNRDSSVIYPPMSLLSTDHGLPPEKTVVGRRSTDSYFLIVSRLVPYKRIDIAVRAFNKLGLPLKIVGTGSEMQKLKNMARKNIEFLGYLTPEELVRYYQDCNCLIFPGLEDFGLTILEAQSFGKPVIAYKGGGALESIIEGKTGLFFDKPNSESLMRAIEQFSNLTIDSNDCIKNAQKFSFRNFKEELMNIINNL